MAFAEKDLGNSDAALVHFQMVQKLDPDNQEAAGIIRLLSRTNSSSKQPKKARSSHFQTDNLPSPDDKSDIVELRNTVKALAFEIARAKRRAQPSDKTVMRLEETVVALQNDLNASRTTMESRLI